MSGDESKDLSASTSSADISNLQENFSKQQKKITALKELVSNSKSTSSAQEKVKNIAQRLTLLKSKARSRGASAQSQSEQTPSLSSSVQQAQNHLVIPDHVAEQSILSQSHLSIGSPMPNSNSTPNPTPIKPLGASNTSLASIGGGNGNTSTGAGSEKIQLLRQQMEQNRVLMAQRASSKQHLEQLVTQLKEKFDTTQQCLEDTSELGKSMTNLSALASYTPVTASRERHRSATDLTTQSFSLEKERIKFLENRCRLLEKQLEKEKANNSGARDEAQHDLTTKRVKELENKVLELEEALKIAETKSLESQSSNENLQRLAAENERLINEIALKDEQISRLKARETVIVTGEQTDETIAMEEKLVEIERQRNEIEEKMKRITDLEAVNDILETTRNDLTAKNNEAEERLLQLEDELNMSNERLQQSREEIHQTEEKCAMLQESLDKMRSSTVEATVTKDDNKADDNGTDNQVQAEMAKQIQELQDEVEKLRTENGQLHETINEKDKLEVSDASIAEKIALLEATIESQREDLHQRTETLQKVEEKLMEKTIELNVLNANFKVLEEKLQATNKSKPLFSTGMSSRNSNVLVDDEDDSAANQALRTENQKLKQKLDESNKAMMKLKLKCKQTEKQVTKLQKTSDLHAEVVKLEQRNEELEQKITELEVEKGQWQLLQVEDAAAAKSSVVKEDNIDVISVAPAASTAELEEQLQTQTATIRLLQEEKFEQSEKFEAVQTELETLRDKLQQHEDSSETARVQSQMSEIHLEEQVEEQAQELDALQQRLQTKEAEYAQLQERLEEAETQKQALDKKLEHYINENMELLDKMEKLSKSSSSAESIEIVERLTQQERAEIDAFTKRLEHGVDTDPTIANAAAGGESGGLVSEVTQTEMGPELSESLAKLREESSELMNKIELFTTERREVLEKMEHLTNENQELQHKIEELTEEKVQLETSSLLAENAKSKLETQLQELTKEKELLASQVAESTAQKAQLSQDLTSLQKSSEVMAALDSREGATLFDKCEHSLSKLNSELEAYRKANDKNAKFNASKKLAKEAKNAHTQLSELLQKVKEASTAVETVTVVETVVAVTAPNGKALAEYEQLTAQNRQLKATVDELRREIQDLRDQEPSTVEITELHGDDVPAAIRASNESEALTAANAKLQSTLAEIKEYEKQMEELQSTVEDLRLQLREAIQAGEEKSTEIVQHKEALVKLRKESEDFDRQLNDKEMLYEKQIEQLTRQRKELEGKCDTYEGEMEILQTLVTEQKQQLIEAYKENEHELNMKMLDLQSRDELITQLREEIEQLKSTLAGDKAVDGAFQQECEKLRESLRINKTLVADQIDELANKQETIDTLNQQIIDLYKTMEENTNKVIEKEDEIVMMEEKLNQNKLELESLRKDNNEQKSVVDKLLSELHSHREHNTQYMNQLQSDLQRLEVNNKKLEEANRDLEHRNKEQLEKMKKYAANLKKRAAQCVEYETKLKDLEKGAVESLQTKEGIDDQLQALQEDNVKLSETVATLERQRDESQSSLAELKRALQSQTVDMLEASERASKLEGELKENREILEQKLQEIVQLQNALAASQEQDIKTQRSTASEVWGQDVRSADVEALSAERITSERLNRELTEKTTLIKKLQDDLKHAEENLSIKVNEITLLRAELMAAQEQASDWGANAFPDIDEPTQLKQKLETTEQHLTNVQNELLTMKEQERATKQAIEEYTSALKQRDERIAELQAQLNVQEQQQNQTLSSTSHHEQRIVELQAQLGANQQRLNEVGEELKAKALKFEKSKAVIKERNNQIHRLQAQLKDLQDKLSSQPEEEVTAIAMPVVESVAAPVLHAELNISRKISQQQQQQGAQQPGISKEEHDQLQQSYNKLKDEFEIEKDNFQTTLSRLETLHDGIKAKLQENLSYIESLEFENNRYKEKICRLEECVATFEERRASMERRANLLDEQLQTRADEYERTEDALVYRLNMLSEHDDVIGRRLLETQEEKEELQERLDRLQNDHKELNSKHTALEKEFQAFRSEANTNADAERQTLREQLKATEAELQRIRSSYDAKLAVKTTEIDELECELSEQLDKMSAEKRILLEDLERARDECTELKDELVRLRETSNSAEQARQELDREVSWLRMQSDNSQQDQYELQELRMQTLQDKTELDNLRHQIETLAGNHEIELQALRTQIAELDTLRMQVGQNQTDDQVFIETENKRLTDLLAEKESLIENYQRQNLQLQMAASAAASTASVNPQQQLNDPFALAFGLPPQQHQQQQQQPQQQQTSVLVGGSTEERERLERELNSLQSELLTLREANTELQQQLQEQSRELDGLRATTRTGIIASSPAPQSPLQPTLMSDVAVVPPPAFFASDQLTHSPFDEIVQARSIEPLEGAVLSRPQQQATPPQQEQRIIEDLQRNVSDLEKHAQDLEQKLAARNQRELEFEERQREIEMRCHEREQQLQSLQVELMQLQQQRDQSQNATLEELTQLRSQLTMLQQQLDERDQQLREVKQQQQQEASKAVQSNVADASRLAELQAILEQRENELADLKRELAQEKRPKTNVFDLESQILPDPSSATIDFGAIGDATDSATNSAPVQFQPTLDMFFGGAAGGGGAANDFERLIMPPAQSTMQASNDPVVEEPIVPQKAYICHPEGESTVQAATFDLGDDWGDSWGGNDGAAEEAHFTKTTAASTGTERTSLVPREQQLEIALQEERERIQELQLAFERSEQQKQELQVKSGKMVKKLKEYKTKLDEQQAQSGGGARKSASVESNSMFADLDAAIQDELKAQISRLEARLEEQQKTHEQLALEKEKLLKRVDVLTAGNERMSEMKERQDMDVQMYQARIRELQDKLNRLDDWGTDEVPAVPVQADQQQLQPPPHHQQQQQQQQMTLTGTANDNNNAQLEAKLTELTAELADANGDRQELQALLEEERANASRAEETVRSLQQRVAALDEAAVQSQSADQDKYSALQKDNHELHERVAHLEQAHAHELQQLRARESQLNSELQVSATKVRELQSEVERLQAILQSTTQAQSESESQLLELRTRLEELTQANRELQSERAERSAESATTLLQEELQHVKDECERLKRINADLEAELQKLSTLHSTATAAGPNEDLSTLLLEKESEILHLKQRVEDLMREDQTEKLVLEILTKNQEIHLLKMQVKHLEDDKVEMEHNLTLQITKEMQSAAGTADVAAKQAEAEAEQRQQLQQRNETLEAELRELQAEKANMEEELKVLNNHVLSSLDQEDKMKAAVLQLDAKNIEIAELRKSLETLKSAAPANVEGTTSSSQVDVVALNAQWELLVEQRCGEIAQMWRTHLDLREREFEAIEARLHEQIAMLQTNTEHGNNTVGTQVSAPSQPPLLKGISAETTTSTPASESTSPSASSSAAASKDGTPLRFVRNATAGGEHHPDEESAADAIIEKMQAALESQELEIVTLKEQLAIRSAEYARLAAQYDPFQLQTTTSHRSMLSADSPQVRRNASPADASLVPKSELDLALYMLHQRDMRCEEMTVELVSLLEERDTLQLKLSNTLRQLETVKTQNIHADSMAVTSQSDTVNTSTTSDSPTMHTVTAGAIASDSADELTQKLYQLTTVNHSKDKVIKEERDQRIRQMEKIQQDMAKIPKAAVSELVGTDLSQTTQSPSSALLNWLWGNQPTNPAAGGLPPN